VSRFDVWRHHERSVAVRPIPARIRASTTRTLPTRTKPAAISHAPHARRRSGWRRAGGVAHSRITTRATAKKGAVALLRCSAA
jgi:hypothetical protein